MEESQNPRSNYQPKQDAVFQEGCVNVPVDSVSKIQMPINYNYAGYMRTSSRTATTPKRGLVQEVRREWLVHEDGAFALQLQDQESRLMLIDLNKKRIFLTLDIFVL